MKRSVIVLSVAILATLFFFLYGMKKEWWWGKDSTEVGVNVSLLRGAIVQNGDLTDIRLSELVNWQGQTLLLRIPEKTCSSCINAQLSALGKLAAGSRKKNLIILTSFQKERDFMVFESSWRSRLSALYNFTDTLCSWDRSNRPYYLLVDKSLNVIRARRLQKPELD